MRQHLCLLLLLLLDIYHSSSVSGEEGKSAELDDQEGIEEAEVEKRPFLYDPVKLYGRELKNLYKPSRSVYRRRQFGFDLGKRNDAEVDKRRQFGFDLGKRSFKKRRQFGFDLGKRDYVDEMKKRRQFGFDLGKRRQFGFDLGKRSRDEYEKRRQFGFDLGKREVLVSNDVE